MKIGANVVKGLVVGVVGAVLGTTVTLVVQAIKNATAKPTEIVVEETAEVIEE